MPGEGEDGAEAAEEATPEGETPPEGMDDDDIENNAPLSAMEAELKPRVLETFDLIASNYTSCAACRTRTSPAGWKTPSSRRRRTARLKKLKDDIIVSVKSLSLNNNRIEALVEQLYDINKRLIPHETYRCAWPRAMVSPATTSWKQHIGGELDPKWLLRVSKLGSRLEGVRRAGEGPDQGPARGHPYDGLGDGPRVSVSSVRSC